MTPPLEFIGRLRSILIIAATFAGLTATGPAAAQIFKCIDADGRVSYAGRPCPEGTTLVDTFAESRSRVRLPPRPRSTASRGDPTAAPGTAPASPPASPPSERPREVAPPVREGSAEGDGTA